MADGRDSSSGGVGSGPATDRYNDPVIDPTLNVKEKMADIERRQDDLREAESKHVREIVGLRAKYDEELRIAETNRIDAIRAVDVAAVQQTAKVQADQATALAQTVVQSAEALRTQQAAATEAQGVRLQTALEPIQKAVEDLRRAQYEAQGQKSQVVETRSATQENVQRGSAQVAYVVAAIAAATFLVLFIGMIVTVLATQ